jgi:hypothetical protein
MGLRAAVACVVGVLAGVAHADEPKETVEKSAERPAEPEAPDVQPTGEPLLRFEPSAFGALGVQSYDEQIARFVVSPGFELSAFGAWKQETPLDIARGDSELVRGWSAGGSVTYDLGWAKLTFHGAYNRVENELGRGDNIVVGVDLTRTFRISRNVTGFVGISFGMLRWRGATPPPGESNAVTGWLRAGLNWK